MKRTLALLTTVLVASGHMAIAEGVVGSNYWSGAIGASAALDYDPALSGGLAGDLNIDFDTGYAVGFAFGRYFSTNVRAEVELAYQSMDASGSTLTNSFFPGGLDTGTNGGSIDTTFLFVNGWYDIPTSGQVTPYVGGGLGLAYVSGSVAAQGGAPLLADGSDTVFAGQLGVGVAIELGNGGIVDIGYRFRSATDVTLGVQSGSQSRGANLKSNSVLIGYRMSF